MTNIKIEDIYPNICELLKTGQDKAKSDFHLMTFTTQPANSRIVVLRKFDPKRRTIIFHTDWRSEKVKEIQANQEVGILFYDRELKTQLRFKAFAHVHYLDDIAKARWEDTKDHSRKCYASEFAEGTELEQAGDGLPEGLQHPGRDLTEEEQERAWNNFCVIVCNYSELDYLELNSKGHIRTKFEWDKNSEITGKWIVP